MEQQVKRSAEEINDIVYVKLDNECGARVNYWAERLEQMRRDGNDHGDDWEIAVRMYTNWTRIREQQR